MGPVGIPARGPSSPAVRCLVVFRITVTSSLALAIQIAACNRTDVPPDYSGLGNFDTTNLRIAARADTFVIKAEVAATEDQQRLGLMERKQLADGAGMLFTYDSVQDSLAAFWMFRTRIPLDIAFVDSAGRIASIQHMVPCESPNAAVCPKYPAGARFTKALEVPAGYFARHGIEVGDVVVR